MSDEILKAEDVIKPEFYEEYVKTRDAIWEQLVFVTNGLIISRKIVEFPWTILAGSQNRTFWNLTSKALFDSIVTALATITINKDDLTISRFKNKILKTYLADQHVRNNLHGQLKKLKSSSITDIEDKIYKVRNSHIAHLDFVQKTGIGLTPQEVILYHIPIDELESIAESILEVLNLLSFNVYLRVILWDYTPKQNYMTDIDKLLSHVASQSFLLREPQNKYHADKVKEELEKLSPEDRATVEYWRERVEKMNGRN